MRNVTSTVYYINSLPDWFYIKDSVKTMSSYWWVTDIVVLHTDPKRPDYFGELEEEYFKVTEHWKDFGSGFDKSVINGGFNEIACRDYGVSLAEEKGNEWIICCDPDEFFTPLLKDILIYMTDEKIDKVVELSCFPFISPSIYIWDRNSAHGSTFVMHDPHIRAWRSSEKMRYKQGWRSKHKTNKTQDCSVNPTKRRFYEPKICHIHLHDFYGHKTSRLPSHLLGEIDKDYRILENPREVFPDHYIQAYVDHLKDINK